MELPHYVRLALANWAVFVICLCLGVGGSAAFSAAQTPKYVATAKVFASTSAAANLNDLSQASTYTQQLIASYADLATTSSVLSQVIDRLHLDTTPAQLASQVTATAELDEVIVAVTASDSSAKGAARLANAVTEQLSASVNKLTPRASNGVAPVAIVQIDEAAPPSSPDSPKLFVNLLIGFFAGFALALVIATVRQLFDTRIRSVAEAARVSGRPVLGSVSWAPASGGGRPAIVLDRATDARAESYRTIRANVQFTEYPHEHPVLVVTSALENEGKSTTVANLAIAMADAGTNVVVIDADLRRPHLAEFFGVSGDEGTTDILAGKASVESVVQRWSATGPDIITSGDVPPNPNELMQPRHMKSVLDELRKQYDVVLIDAPPLLHVSDAAILAQQADATIVVCSAREARGPQLRSALAALELAGARIAGLVVTKLPAASARRSGDSALPAWVAALPEAGSASAQRG